MTKKPRSKSSTKKAHQLIKQFTKNHHPEKLKDKMWDHLVYLMNSPDLNHSPHIEKIVALEIHKDLTGLIDAIYMLHT